MCLVVNRGKGLSTVPRFLSRPPVMIHSCGTKVGFYGGAYEGLMFVLLTACYPATSCYCRALTMEHAVWGHSFILVEGLTCV